MQNLILIVTFLSLVGLFVQNYVQLSQDAEASPTELTFKEWLKHTWLEIILNLLCFGAVCFGINIGLNEKAVEVAVGSQSDAFKLAFVSALATATAIKKFVQVTLLPIFSALFNARTARSLLRDKVIDAKRT